MNEYHSIIFVFYLLAGLVHTIPQMNNFVIYKGFFDVSVRPSSYDSGDSEAKVTERYLPDRILGTKCFILNRIPKEIIFSRIESIFIV